MTFDLQAHRGGAGLHPENTLEAFGAALALGVSTLELDVHLTARRRRGRQPRPGAGRRPADPQLTRADLPPTMPLLRDVAALLDGSRRRRRRGSTSRSSTTPCAAAELTSRADFVAVTLDAIRIDGLVERTSIQCFDWGVLRPRRPGGAARTPQPARLPEYLKPAATGRPRGSTASSGGALRAPPPPRRASTPISPIHGSPFLSGVDDAAYVPFATGELVDGAHAVGLQVIPYVVDDPPTMAALVRLGVDGLITNCPDRLRDVLAAAGRDLPPAHTRAGDVTDATDPAPAWSYKHEPSRRRAGRRPTGPHPARRARRRRRLVPTGHPSGPPHPARSSTSPTSTPEPPPGWPGRSGPAVGSPSTGPVAPHLPHATSRPSPPWARGTSCRPVAPARRGSAGSAPTARPALAVALRLRTRGVARRRGGRLHGPRGGVKVIDSEGDRVLRMPPVPGVRRPQAPRRGLGDDCREDATSNGCAVLVNSTRRPVSWSYLLPRHRRPHAVPLGLHRARSLARRHHDVSDTGTCSVMRRGFRVRWRTCGNQLSDISPDTRHLVGTPAYGDGFGPTRLDVLDLRTGDRTRSWTADRRGRSATYFDEVWEDADHLLVVTFQAGEWAVVRLGLDGSMEYAVRRSPTGRPGDAAAPQTGVTRLDPCTRVGEIPDAHCRRVLLHWWS